MRRLSCVLVAFVAALAPAVALAAGSHAPRVQPVVGPSRAELVAPVCQTALDPPARTISVTAVMRPLSGTAKLAIEFQLLERSAGALAWTPLAAPGLSTWGSPTNPSTLGRRPGDVWYVKKPVANLDAPASYRFAVSFRWTAAGGKVLATTTLMGKVCHQPELRPDLTVNSVSVVSTHAGSGPADYSVVIGNAGASGAGPFTVQLNDAGQQLDLQVPHLGSHRTVRLLFRGAPACSTAQPPSVTVDPGNLIDVYSRSQATLAAQCTAPAAAGGTSTSAA